MDYIIHNFTRITFSIDGPDFIQNIHRPAMNGTASFDTVFANAKNYIIQSLNLLLELLFLN